MPYDQAGYDNIMPGEEPDFNETQIRPQTVAISHNEYDKKSNQLKAIIGLCIQIPERDARIKLVAAILKVSRADAAWFLVECDASFAEAFRNLPVDDGIVR
jgi:hypothetical protein